MHRSDHDIIKVQPTY